MTVRLERLRLNVRGEYGRDAPHTVIWVEGSTKVVEAPGRSRVGFAPQRPFNAVSRNEFADHGQH